MTGGTEAASRVLLDSGNRAIAEELARCSARGAVVPFVGAGLSLDFGYPLWGDVLKKQALGTSIELSVQSLVADGRLEEAASELLRELGGGFEQLVRVTFDSARMGQPSNGNAPRQLARFTPSCVVTTNYDEVLETAFAQERKPFDQIARPTDEELLCSAFHGSRHYLLKIHGHWHEGSSRILTIEQYEKYYGGRDAGSFNWKRGLPLALRLMFQTRSVLFLGCSLENDRYLQVLRRLVEGQEYVPMHFALLEMPARDVPARRTKLIRELGVFPIFFPRGGFRLIPDILEALGTPPAPTLEKRPLERRDVVPGAVPPPPPPDALVEAIAAHRCLLFAGAGASRDAGLPTWREVGGHLLDVVGAAGSLPAEERARRASTLELASSDEVFEVVEACRQANPALVEQVLKLRLDASGRDSMTHDLLARIPFRGAITSNWDVFIESKRPNARVLLPDDIDRLGADGVPTLLTRANEFPVIKMHGSADRPETMLIGRNDYEPWMQRRERYRAFLVMLLATQSVFFYGHSLSDPSVLELLREAARAVPRPRHFALLWSVTDDGRRELYDSFGIEAISIPGDIDPRPAIAFLEQLLAAVGRAR